MRFHRATSPPASRLLELPLLPSPFVPPVILPGGYLIEDFTNQFSALKPLYTATATAISSAAVALRLARGKRKRT